MDAVNKLDINKPTELKERFPLTRFSFRTEERGAEWILFAESIPSKLFEEMDFELGCYNPVADIWTVGKYEVALMAGEITSQHEHFLQLKKIDYAALIDIPDLTEPGLVVFDMDSTAIQIECIDEIAKLAGVGEQVSEVTERAMQGELDFEQSLRERVATLKGADESILQQVRESLPLMPDMAELIISFKQYGWKTAIASGGFTYFSDYLKDILDLDFARSNVLQIEQGKLTGKVLGDVVSAQTKADILQMLAEENGIALENTIAVGDGANDLLMMGRAGLGIAFHAKPRVEQQAQVSVRYTGLGGVMCILSAGAIN
ncbi:phosphoserine phosphatase [Vibrio sp. SCSIO 43137]|uniref:phosphoserine phosphatase n=1 Tax=Vibrio sp. SCSIO 43137 TaxID=3021011 RepID=UPI0023083652|nr:phosphoserine phosphatase [Vibrio sp. SCSIO 43137]WCE29132.1 phosphoserine phosphatase [Vibrio sp. SCSIO 43137]